VLNYADVRTPLVRSGPSVWALCRSPVGFRATGRLCGCLRHQRRRLPPARSPRCRCRRAWHRPPRRARTRAVRGSSDWDADSDWRPSRAKYGAGAGVVRGGIVSGRRHDVGPLPQRRLPSESQGRDAAARRRPAVLMLAASTGLPLGTIPPATAPGFQTGFRRAGLRPGVSVRGGRAGLPPSGRPIRRPERSASGSRSGFRDAFYTVGMVNASRKAFRDPPCVPPGLSGSGQVSGSTRSRARPEVEGGSGGRTV
jgi:hypothetical protein